MELKIKNHAPASSKQGSKPCPQTPLSGGKTAVLILGHGSPVEKANDTLHKIANAVMSKGGYAIVQPAFLQFAKPDFQGAVDILAEHGVRDIIVHPYFLYMGAHVTKDLPIEIETAKKKYPDLNITLAGHLGFHEKLVEVAVERIEEAAVNFKFQISNFKLESKTQNQHPIEAESFRIIEKQLDASRFSPLEIPIVKRVIHTTADFEYADLIRFSPNAVEDGIGAILKGADIITDVKMAAVGINKVMLERFGGEVKCFVSDEDVIQSAKKDNITKTAAGIRKALTSAPRTMRHTPKIIAIGNAPTALMELTRMIKQGIADPSLVIGVPVGFVDAEEAKEELMKLDAPYISIKGKKGGSTVAVAIVNALLMLAEVNLYHH